MSRKAKTRFGAGALLTLGFMAAATTAVLAWPQPDTDATGGTCTGLGPRAPIVWTIYNRETGNTGSPATVTNLTVTPNLPTTGTAGPLPNTGSSSTTFQTAVPADYAGPVTIAYVMSWSGSDGHDERHGSATINVVACPGPVTGTSTPPPPCTTTIPSCGSTTTPSSTPGTQPPPSSSTPPGTQPPVQTPCTTAPTPCVPTSSVPCGGACTPGCGTCPPPPPPSSTSTSLPHCGRPTPTTAPTTSHPPTCIPTTTTTRVPASSTTSAPPAPTTGPTYPPTTDVPDPWAPPTTVAVLRRGDMLPVTGSSTGPLAFLAVVLLGGGVVVLRRARALDA